MALASALTLGSLAAVVAVPSGIAHAEAPATSVTGLRLGATGDPVRRVQEALIAKGYAVAGGADGVFGAGTERALKQFQTSQGLNANGTVTNATAIALGLLANPFVGLAQGATGDAVRQLQQNLINRGIAVAGGADGVYGAGTTAAVKQFQRQLGYYPSGSVNAATAAALGQANAGGPAVTPVQPVTVDEPADRGQPAATPAAGTGTANLVGLKVGDRGDGVRQVQQLLLDRGVTIVGGADGVFGALTQAALRSFQSAKGLTVSGSVDQATLDALRGGNSGGGAGHGLTNNGGQSGSLVGLTLGATGDGVKQVQTALLQAGYTVRGGADGVFGNATQSALKAFQTSNGLEGSGRVDARTAEAIAKVLGTATPGATPNATFVGLQAGAAGPAVQELQKRLLALGIALRGGADGIYGPATAQAVKAFQTAQGLGASGKVDDATAAALANPATVTPTPPAAPGGYAEYGESGERVIALQQALVKAGITVKGGVDGKFGSATSAAVMEFQRQKGLTVSGKVDAPTAAALGLGAAPAPIVTPPPAITLEAFPTGKPCGFADTWQYDRGGGRRHMGLDIIAPTGTPVYASLTGKVSQVYVDAPGSLSGNGLKIALPNGTYVFYAHLTALADGIQLGVPVTAGQLIGTVGSTGNAATPHLHFEIHPGGGAAINPYPIVKAMGGC